jgi:hypothetical protein
MEITLSAKRRIAAAVCVSLAIFLIVFLRVLFDQWQGYDQGMDSLAKGDKKNAVMYFDRALNAHIPFSPVEQKAKDEMLKLAVKYEADHEYELALLCYETVRTSRYLARHFWVPDNESIPAWNDRIASIKATLLVRDGMVKDFRQGYDQQMAILSKDYSPSVFWSLIVVISFWAYIGLIVLWIFKRQRFCVPAIIFFFLLWITALYLA